MKRNVLIEIGHKICKCWILVWDGNIYTQPNRTIKEWVKIWVSISPLTSKAPHLSLNFKFNFYSDCSYVRYMVYRIICYSSLSWRATIWMIVHRCVGLWTLLLKLSVFFTENVSENRETLTFDPLDGVWGHDKFLKHLIISDNGWLFHFAR